MRTVSCDAIPWTEVSGHRSGTIEFKQLFSGQEGAPENFELALTRTRGAYYTPRHRHNYDQVRYAIEGELSYAPDKVMRPGEVGFFPEGTFYGPQDVRNEPLFVVLQCGGASGQGFLSYAQLRKGHQELAAMGEFKDGVFHRRTGEGPRTQDGYEAVWEHLQLRELVYPKARYAEPVIMDPDAFFSPTSTEEAITRVLGTFTERKTRVEMSRLPEGSSLTIEADDATRLGFVTSGAVRCGDETIEAPSAIEGGPGEPLALRAEVEAEILWMILPPVKPHEHEHAP